MTSRDPIPTVRWQFGTPHKEHNCPVEQVKLSTEEVKRLLAAGTRIEDLGKVESDQREHAPSVCAVCGDEPASSVPFSFPGPDGKWFTGYFCWNCKPSDLGLSLVIADI